MNKPAEKELAIPIIFGLVRQLVFQTGISPHTMPCMKPPMMKATLIQKISVQLSPQLFAGFSYPTFISSSMFRLISEIVAKKNVLYN